MNPRLFTLCAVLAPFAAHAAPQALRVCVDHASATESRDTAVAQRVAQQAGLSLAVVGFDSSDDEVSAKQFRTLLKEKCDLVMGYPMEVGDSTLPPGLLATKPYAQTGFVLVTAPGVTARRLADFPADTEVAVTFETPPTLYFVDHSNISADIHTTEAGTMAAVATGAAHAAMLWQPTVEAYKAAHPDAAKLAVTPLDEPHARFNVVALYLPQGSHQADTFNASKISLNTPASSGTTPPALYTEAQAKLGFVKYIGNCAMCHGTHLEGRSGPSLKGPNWANAKAAYTVGEVFSVVSQQMPAISPGQLPHDDYVQIMAYLLQQNGYPAGSTPLEFDKATVSTTPLLYHPS
jgi:mono/diheme cytochrome c family protein